MNPITAAFAAAALILAFASQASAITVRHAQGELQLDSVPQKVIVLDIASLDTLDALGVKVAGVASGPKPDYLSKYQGGEVPTFGGLFEPDFEAIAAAKPDLIIAGGRSGGKYQQLSRIAPTIDMTVDRKDVVASTKRNIETLASIFGKEAEVKDQLADIDASVAKLRTLGKSAGRTLIIITTGGRISAHGPGSRFAVLYSDFGLAPAAEGLNTANHGQPISHEFIAENNPDWLFVVDRDAVTGGKGHPARQVLDNALVGRTTAWQKQQVAYLDPVDWYLVGLGGLTSLKSGIAEVTSALSK